MDRVLSWFEFSLVLPESQSQLLYVEWSFSFRGSRGRIIWQFSFMGFGRYGKKETFGVLSKNFDMGLIVDEIRFHPPQSPSLILFSACSSSPLIDEAWRWQTVQSCRALSLDCYLLLLERLCSNPMATPWEAEGWKGWTGWFRTVCPPSSHASQALWFVRWSM